MSDRSNAMGKHLITIAITGLTTFSLTELKLCGDVEKRAIQTEARVSSLEEGAKALHADMAALMGQNTELITLLKVQHQMRQP